MKYINDDISDIQNAHKHILRISMLLSKVRNSISNSFESANVIRLVEINAVICEINSYMENAGNSEIKEELLKAYHTINHVIGKCISIDYIGNRAMLEVLKGFLSYADDNILRVIQIIEFRKNKDNH